ncbi:AhpC/TSA family protein [Sinorhizobium numidicum]|uniref:AhpC/TSA family protein n=1 Tax=Sinorhizobium numidicum TaxID=680248 RepID=A0ABY8CYF5_9HYPH|nr:peroxiredoxin-like family protein [Sinorhizobium numidicum]WEX77017.1 AhpC/TSA family protein [Sinorhizobium numidicum]WEX83676.1 AhpC/TSA family protein [Sinorhizobium numidicum]
MADQHNRGPLRPGDRAPNVVLDAITKEGKIAIDDFRGHKPVLVGLFRGLQCPFCRRQIAAISQLKAALNEKGIETLTVVNTPVERARLYFRYHPLPNLLAAADPERISHQAFGLPNPEFTEDEDDWPRKISMQTVMSMRVEMPGELPEPMNPIAGSQYLQQADGYQMTEEDKRMEATAMGQLVGEFLLDRDGVVRWCFTEATPDGGNMFRSPAPEEVMSAASQVAH